MHQFIGGCEFDEASGEVRRDGISTRLEPQPAAVLALLARRAGDLVTHDEIRRALWGDDTHVSFQDSVHYCIRQVRAALGDQAREARFIETIPKRGYRLRSNAVLTATAAPLSAPMPRVSVRQRLAVACVASLLAAGVVIVEQRPNNHHQIAVAVLKTLHDLVF
jgi:DNA-binding winged helix-turn-helix (wHTH) protein